MATSDLPPPYSSIESPSSSHRPSASSNPSYTSAQSLGPSALPQDGRRKLLLVLVHGFMGDEKSFQSFPAHVHNMVTPLLSETHTVQTKIFPRYRSKKGIQEAAEDFSTWLEPHASYATDVILLGHSMGGLLLAETVLLKSASEDASPLAQRILGTISFDTPFLGMHPGIIKAGLGSLFRSDESSAPTDNPSSPSTLMDPNYNPPFFNDTRLPVRSAWRNAAHFINKHSNNLSAATKQVITSHVDFGKCLADYDGLKVRYCRIRMLEDEDVERRKTVVPGNRPPPRVRFVNYYTASTGRPKRPKSPVKSNSGIDKTPSMDMIEVEPSSTSRADSQPSNRSLSMSEKAPVIAVESDDDEDIDEAALSDLSDLDPIADDPESDFDDSMPVAGDRASIRSTAKSRRRLAAPAGSKVLPPYEAPSPSYLATLDPTPLTEPPPPHIAPPSSVVASASDFNPDQPGLPKEPEALPPPPSAQQFADLEKYRNELHEHGKMSKEYFKQTKARQEALYNKFVAESAARTTAHHAEIVRQSELIGEEAKRFSEGVAENVRITVEIQAEEIKSLQEHRKLVAEYRQMCGLNQAKLKAKLDKADKKLAEKQAKVNKKAQQDREKMLAKEAKMLKKLGKRNANPRGGSSTTTESRSAADTADLESVTSGDTFFDATKAIAGMGMKDNDDHQIPSGAALRASPEPDTYPPDRKFNPEFSKEPSNLQHSDSADPSQQGYDMTTAAIAVTDCPPRTFSSTSNGSTTVNTALTPTTSSSSQVSLQTDSAAGSFSYDSLTPQTSVNEYDTAARTSTPKPRKDKKFCNLPPADASGMYDPTWVRVYMQNVDEVGAHCGLFFANAATDGPADAQGWSARYSGLVCDVSERIERWVGEEMSRRYVEEMAEDGLQ